MESAISSLPPETRTWVDKVVGWFATEFGPAFGYSFDFSLESLIKVDEFLGKMSVGMKRLPEEEYQKRRWVAANVAAAYMGETIVKNCPTARLVLLQNDQLKKIDDPEHESIVALITMFLVFSKP